MVEPLFWLGLSLLLVAVSLTAVFVAALPALRELARAARSAEKLFDTLSRELPPTLESIRLTGMEITELTDEVSEGVQSAGRVVQQLDQGISGVKRQAKQAQVTTRSLVVGIRAAWKAFHQSATPSTSRRSREGARSLSPESRYSDARSTDSRNSDARNGSDSIDRLSASARIPVDREVEPSYREAMAYERAAYESDKEDTPGFDRDRED